MIRILCRGGYGLSISILFMACLGNERTETPDTIAISSSENRESISHEISSESSVNDLSTGSSSTETFSSIQEHQVLSSDEKSISSSEDVSSEDLSSSSQIIIELSSSDFLNDLSSSEEEEPEDVLTPEEEGWSLIWADEFDGDGAIDGTKWQHEIWGPGRVNQESQAYTNRLENSRKEDGHLIIEAREDYWGGNQYTSGRLITMNKFDFTYGKVEVRAMLPGGRGSWPAIWMLGSNIQSISWPACGEVDIMEYVGYDPDAIHGSAHGNNFYFQVGTQQNGHVEVEDVETEFHVYGIEWFEDRIDYLVDGKKYFTAVPKGGDQYNHDAWPFSKPHFLILNIAVGGIWGGVEGIDANAFPMVMSVDYVRVYQK